MGYEKFISENEAASIAGVSVSTLNRFAEAGYLQVETDADGLRLFSKKELGDVFGLSRERLVARQTQSSKASPPKATQVNRTENISPKEDNLQPDLNKQQSKKYETEPVTPGDSAIKEDLSLNYSEPSASSLSSDKITADSLDDKVVLDEDVWQDGHKAINATPDLIADSDGNIKVNSLDAEPAADETVIKEMQQSQPEGNLERLNNLIRLQEDLLDAREKELHDLKRQRDWLQRRVEKLEEKSERDQMLLLSEKQMTRQLLGQAEKRVSPLRAALDWFGFNSSNEER